MSFFGILFSLLSHQAKAQQQSQIKVLSPQSGLILFDQIRAAELNRNAALCSDTVYRQFLNNTAKEKKLLARFPILTAYKNSFEKILYNLKNTKANPSELEIWHVYNMGYIFRTRTITIGVDLASKYCEKLAPYLDVLLITHPHNDHFSEKMAMAMHSLNKPVISNFWYKGKVVRNDTVLHFDEVLIHCIPGDHYYWDEKSRNDILMFEIDFGDRCSHPIVLHTGDNSNPAKVKTINPVDILIPHIRMGYNLPDFVNDLKPKYLFMSHLLELSHPRTEKGYRWNIDDALSDVDKIIFSTLVIPLWGEAYMYKVGK